MGKKMLNSFLLRHRAAVYWLTLVCMISAWVGTAPAASRRADRLTPEMRSAIRKGLSYLAHQQNPDGSFSGNGGRQTGIVAACATAFMSNGQLPGSGRYGTQVTRAINYIIRSQHPDGLLYYAGHGYPPMYNHGLSVLALAEAYGQYPDKHLFDVLQNAVNLICSCQNPAGGWRYQPYVDGADLSVTVMQLMALRAARDVGIRVPSRVIRDGIAYVKSCHNGIGSGKDGGFAYMPGGVSTFGCTGAGVTSFQVVGKMRDRAVLEGVHYLLGFAPLGQKTVQPEFYFYDLYYATMGIYQAQGIGRVGREAWNKWYPAVVRNLLATQQSDGRWIGQGWGRKYETAAALLLLNIPMRVLPVYQR